MATGWQKGPYDVETGFQWRHYNDIEGIKTQTGVYFKSLLCSNKLIYRHSETFFDFQRLCNFEKYKKVNFEKFGFQWRNLKMTSNAPALKRVCIRKGYFDKTNA